MTSVGCKPIIPSKMRVTESLPAEVIVAGSLRPPVPAAPAGGPAAALQWLWAWCCLWPQVAKIILASVIFFDTIRGKFL